MPPQCYALASAVLFAAGMPSEKWLLQHTQPVMLAGLLYMSSGIGMTGALMLQKAFATPKTTSAAHSFEVTKLDLAWLGGAVVVGGILAPLLLLAALNTAKASSVALLLNFEIVVTALIARFVFKESLGKRVVLGLGTIFVGGLCLTWSKDFSASWSLLLAVAACACWAADSNLTSQVKHIGPMQIARAKGLIAGTFNISLAFILGNHLPDIVTICGAALAGIFSHGISLTCFVTAMRQIGAARAVAYVATEPFIAALLSVLFLHESLSANMLLGGSLMGLGVWLDMTAKHQPKHMDGTIIASGLSEIEAND